MIQINRKEDCCGCHACSNVCPKNAITMEEDKNGFKYPKVDQNKCIDCSLCEKRCPILNNKVLKNQPIAYACINKDEEQRKNSSSGGIFSLLAEKILDNGGIVFGAKFNDDFDVEHDYIVKKEELYKLRGSKYVQSSINDTFKKAKEYLEQDKYVLFTGTPCQIEGLKSFLNKDYKKLFTQDIICHGVPAPNAWRKYKKYILNGSKIQKINFRNKEYGWKNFSINIKTDKTNYLVSHHKDIYMGAFLNDILLRESCYECKFKKENRISDITLADFWGIEKINSKIDDDRGISLVILNTENGKNIFDMIKDKMIYELVDLREALLYNKSMIRSVDKNKNREKFLSELENKEFDKCVKKYINNTSILKKIKNKIVKFLK